jgi:cysteine-rich repeat protein
MNAMRKSSSLFRPTLSTSLLLLAAMVLGVTARNFSRSQLAQVPRPGPGQSSSSCYPKDDTCNGYPMGTCQKTNQYCDGWILCPPYNSCTGQVCTHEDYCLLPSPGINNDIFVRYHFCAKKSSQLCNTDSDCSNCSGIFRCPANQTPDLVTHACDCPKNTTLRNDYCKPPAYNTTYGDVVRTCAYDYYKRCSANSDCSVQFCEQNCTGTAVWDENTHACVTPSCGDGMCQQTESQTTCPLDCGCPNGESLLPGGTCGIPAVCGNGITEQGEECDDGAMNGASDDGCKANCTLAPLWTCSFVPTHCPGSPEVHEQMGSSASSLLQNIATCYTSTCTSKETCNKPFMSFGGTAALGAITVAGNTMYVSDDLGSIYIVDLASHSLLKKITIPLKVGVATAGVTTANNKVFFSYARAGNSAGQYLDAFVAIDTTTNTISGTLPGPFQDFPAGFNWGNYSPYGLMTAGTNVYLVMANGPDASVPDMVFPINSTNNGMATPARDLPAYTPGLQTSAWWYDGMTSAAVGSKLYVSFGSRFGVISMDPRIVYEVTGDSRQIPSYYPGSPTATTVIRVTPNILTKNITIPGSYYIAVAAAGGKVYVSRGNTIFVVDSNTDTLTKEAYWSPPLSNGLMFFTGMGGKVYGTQYGSNALYAFDPATDDLFCSGTVTSAASSSSTSAAVSSFASSCPSVHITTCSAPPPAGCHYVTIPNPSCPLDPTCILVCGSSSSTFAASSSSTFAHSSGESSSDCNPMGVPADVESRFLDNSLSKLDAYAISNKDANGKYIWYTVRNIARDGQGNVYVNGLRSRGPFSQNNLSGYLTFSVTAKYDKNHHQLWLKTYEGEQAWINDSTGFEPLCAMTDNAGSTYIFGGMLLNQTMTLKYDSDGNLLGWKSGGANSQGVIDPSGPYQQSTPGIFVPDACSTSSASSLPTYCPDNISNCLALPAQTGCQYVTEYLNGCPSSCVLECSSSSNMQGYCCFAGVDPAFNCDSTRVTACAGNGTFFLSQPECQRRCEISSFPSASSDAGASSSFSPFTLCGKICAENDPSTCRNACITLRQKDPNQFLCGKGKVLSFSCEENGPYTCSFHCQ